MKQISKTATVETAYGNPLPEPVRFSYEYEELQKGDLIPAKEVPDQDDLITYINQSATQPRAQQPRI